MGLDERLEAARRDYQRLTPPVATSEPTSTPAPSRSRAARGWLVAAAFAAVVGGAVAVAVLVSSSEPPGQAVTVGNGDVDAAPTSAVEPTPPSPAIVLAGGPVVEPGGVLRASIPTDQLADPWNDRPVLCAEVAGPRPQRFCDPAATNPVRRVPADPATEAVRIDYDVVVIGRVLTPDGWADCATPGVACRVHARSAGGALIASEPIVMTGPALEDPSLRATPLGDGAFRVEVTGAAQPPVADLWVAVCSFGPGTPTEGPYGDTDWGEWTRDDFVVQNCDTNTPTLVEAPDGSSLTVEVPQDLIYGYLGWADCAARPCYLRVESRSGHTFASGAVADTLSVAAMLPMAPGAVHGERPSLTIATPGPHAPGEVIDVVVAGLPDDVRANVGLCHVDGPWSCGYGTAGDSPVGNGRHPVTLPPNGNDCATGCYLELEGYANAIPPYAVAPITIVTPDQ